MHRDFLLPERLAGADGIGPAIDLHARRGKQMYLTLGITRITEHQNIEVSLWGSGDDEHWGSEPLAKFPAKFYCGIYSILLNLTARREVKFVRVQWKMGHRGKGETTPMCEFYVRAEEPGRRARAAVY